MTRIFSYTILIVFISSCSNRYLRTSNAFLNAASPGEKSRYMSEDYHSYFASKAGSGKNRQEALASFNEWDGQLHPDIKITHHSHNDSIYEVTFNEQNDFSKLIDYPGWKGANRFIFNSQGLIKEAIYFPDSTNKSYKPLLQPAIEWLKANMPDSLATVYKDGKLIQTSSTAREWVSLLKQWRARR